jgi:hypothetical protein
MNSRSRVFWNEEEAASELGLPVEEVKQQLTGLEEYDGRFLVTDILEAVNTSLSAARAAERQARTDFIELRNSILKGELVETDPMEREAGLIVATIKTLIVGSTLNREKQAELYQRLEDCKQVLGDISQELDPTGIWA